MAEVFDVVDGEDRVIGSARRDQVHGNPALIHRVAHVLLFDSGGRLFLQKRSLTKDVQPGKWDTSVGGHLDLGESYDRAAVRELAEELGIHLRNEEILQKENLFRGFRGQEAPASPDAASFPGDSGIPEGRLVSLYKYMHANSYESEFVATYALVWNGPVHLQESEISDGRFWSLSEINETPDKEIFTPNFLHEVGKFREFLFAP